MHFVNALPAACWAHADRHPTSSRRSRRRRGRPGALAGPRRGDGVDARQLARQPDRRRDRRAGLPRARAGRGRRRPPVGGGGDPPGGGPPAPVVVHPAAVAADRAARRGVRGDERVAVLGDGPGRPRVGRHAGVPRPAVGRPGRAGSRLAASDGRTVACALLAARRGRRAHPAAADHRRPRHRPRADRGAVLGGLHPAQPHARAAPAGRRGLGGGGGAVGAGVRADRDRRAGRPPADGGGAGLRRGAGCCRRWCRWSPTCSRCAGCPRTRSGSS